MCKICKDCKIEKDLDQFYNANDRPSGKMVYCKDCFNKRCGDRWIKRKINAIKYLGNQCSDCGLHIINTHYSVFEFHHLDPKHKDYDWSKLRLRSQKDIDQELDKCVLLCANCHRVRHALSN